jgi:hypothetical protein
MWGRKGGAVDGCGEKVNKNLRLERKESGGAGIASSRDLAFAGVARNDVVAMQDKQLNAQP